MFNLGRIKKIPVILLCAVASQLAVAQPAIAQTDEARLKAAFLYRFAQFAEWPEEKFSSGHQRFVLCHIGSSEMRAALDIIRGKKVLDAIVDIRAVADSGRLNSCHMLYMQAFDKTRHSRLLAESHRMNILTVSDQPDFAEKGGVIELVRQDNRIRFEINTHAAGRAGIKLSAQLLKLAAVVHENE